ncbi:hypothetical protein ACQ86G_02125 [Roseateles chitinivorans]|uniref:hypothetical protein n=1 Tax=Roseateles chitinivorans TaxID=2917965 RepID=UPI003D67D50D
MALLLPIDWFGPTGLLLREFGAKPVSLVLTLGGLYGLALCRAPRGVAGRVERNAVLVCGALLALGTIAFCINQIVDWTPRGYSRSPFVQFVNQTLLVVTAMLSVLGNARLAWRHDAVARLRRIVPGAAAFHLVIFSLQALSIIDHFSPVLLLFRNDEGVIERATGLMSEPSYYGVCAALFGAMLLTLPAQGARRVFHVLLAGALYGTAIGINAKTMVIVAGAQIMLAILFPSAGRISTRTALLLLAAIGVAAVSFIVRFSALDVSENLSSAMRFGSTLLSINVSTSGYAIPGIGIGQFHFFYRDAFAPEFLYLSEEGLNQLSLDAANRASTFNFYTRLLLEVGLAGFIGFFLAMLALLRTRLNANTRYIATLLSGSLGFLMTQDTYFYPPLVMACALLLSVRYLPVTSDPAHPQRP